MPYEMLLEHWRDVRARLEPADGDAAAAAEAELRALLGAVGLRRGAPVSQAPRRKNDAPAARLTQQLSPVVLTRKGRAR
eukprot:6195784-Pleurochrysis_carterae.AAC.6